jgi:hypothetical protein
MREVIVLASSSCCILKIIPLTAALERHRSDWYAKAVGILKDFCRTPDQPVTSASVCEQCGVALLMVVLIDLASP